MARIAELGGLPGDACRLSRDDAEALLCGMLGRAVLAPGPPRPAGHPGLGDGLAPTAKPAAGRRIFPGPADVTMRASQLLAKYSQEAGHV